MNDTRDLWDRLIANGKPHQWKRAAPRRKAPKRTAKPSGAAERDVLKLLQDAAAMMGVTLLRNNVGALQDRHGRWVTYGVGGPGWPDTIGYQIVTVTPDMVGERIAVFVAVEAKRESGGVVSDRQTRVLEQLRQAGARAGVARSVEDLQRILNSCEHPKSRRSDEVRLGNTKGAGSPPALNGGPINAK